MQRRSWKAGEGQAVRIFTITMDVQLLLGLILYFVLSPITGIALQNFGAAMRDSTLRYFAVEHLLMMVLAVVAVHVGAVMIRRRHDDRSKYVQGAIWMTLSILLILVGIPWQRPLLPFIG
jgi:prepilin signal peptidase PulO-like enzyme (type II secretory pathway)